MSRIFIAGECSLLAKRFEDLMILGNRHEIIWGYNSRTKEQLELCNFRSVWSNDEFELDVTDIMFNKVVQLLCPDVILNFAGMVGTDICNIFEYQAIKSNVFGAFNVAKVSREIGAKLIHFSTTAIFDPDYYDGSLINNLSRKKAKTLYGKSKLVGEELVRFVYPEAIVVRPTFVYGGIEDNHSAISKIIKTIFTKRNEDVLLDPSIKKDYMYVTDLIAALETVIKNGVIGNSYNVSFGRPAKFGDIILMIQTITDSEVHYRLFPELDYLKNHIVDNSEMVKLGWKPEIPLEIGIRMSFDEIRSFYKK